MADTERSFTINIARQASAVTFDYSGRYLAVGSDDGTVRLYETPFLKVKHAIRNIGTPVASIIFSSAKSGEREDESNLHIYVSAGHTLYNFSIQKSNLIYNKQDAIFSSELGKDEEDALNQIALNSSETHLAFTTDSGAVGVLELSSGSIKEMKSCHSSIAWTVAFIPERPNELVSGGYDCLLKHFDYKQGTLHSQYRFEPSPSVAPGVMSLPPFVTGTSISSRGAICASTADGRIWLGLEGEKEKKDVNTKQKGKGKGKYKRSRKWTGITQESSSKKIEDAMIAGLSFITDDEIVACSLYGRLSCYKINRHEEAKNSDRDKLLLEEWTRECDLEKVDCMAVCTSSTDGKKLIAIGGVNKSDKKGSVELRWIS